MAEGVELLVVDQIEDARFPKRVLDLPEWISAPWQYCRHQLPGLVAIDNDPFNIALLQF